MTEAISRVLDLLPFAVPFAVSAGIGLLVARFRPRARRSPILGERLDTDDSSGRQFTGWIILLAYPAISLLCGLAGQTVADVVSPPVFLVLLGLALLAQLIHTGYLGYRTSDRPLLAVGLAAGMGWLGMVSASVSNAALWQAMK